MKTTPPRAPARLNRPTTRYFAGCCLCLGYSGNWPRRKKHRRAATCAGVIDKLLGYALAFGHHEDCTPTHGYAKTREAAMAAFAKIWRRG